MDKTSLLYWFPIIKDLPIPMPRTAWVEIPFDVFCDYMDFPERRAKSPPEAQIVVTEEDLKIVRYTNEIKTKAREIGYPLFLRTDLSSRKHSWEESCYVEKEEDLFRHIWQVVEGNFMADIFGLHCEALVFREYIPMASQFTAFWGKLPISPERRYFIRDGKVECHHPYWIEDAIEKGEAPISIRNWREVLAKMNKELDREVELLIGYSLQVANLLPGYWSVDFCRAKDGKWILIDLAEGEKSWHQEH